jgi:hypothetical protein
MKQFDVTVGVDGGRVDGNAGTGIDGEIPIVLDTRNAGEGTRRPSRERDRQ